MDLLEFGEYLALHYGYLGVLLGQIITNSSVLFPIPGFLIVITAGAFLNPLLVGIFAGVGAALGESTGYLLGRGGKDILENKVKLKKIDRFFKRYGVLAIFLFAALPLPFDVVGILSGFAAFNFIYFLIPALAGKIIKHTFLAYSGKEGMTLLEGLLRGELHPKSLAYILTLLIVVGVSYLYYQLKFLKE